MPRYSGPERRHRPRDGRYERSRRFRHVGVALLLVAGALGIASAGAQPTAIVHATSSDVVSLRAIGERMKAAASDALSNAIAGEKSDATEAKPSPERAAVEQGLVAEVAPSSSEAKREPTALDQKLKNHGWSACMMPDPGFGEYLRWQNVAMGQILLPKEGGMAPDGGFDVIIHFHGHEAVRKSFVQVAHGTVLVGIDLGVGSGVYEDAFQLPQKFLDLRASITSALVKHSGNPAAHIRHLVLSSWSAGYGAVQDILRDHPDAADAVLFFDSLHSGYVKGPPQDMHALWGVWKDPIAPVIAYAKRAAKGEKLLWLTHSAIKPPGYASTSEVADFVLAEVGGGRGPLEGTTPLGAELKSGADIGDFHVRGYAGGDEYAHCAHTELLAEVVRDVLEPRWRTEK